MSASTVSITANPTAAAARRRAVEKRHGLDLLDSVAVVSPAATLDGGDKGASGDLWNERDLGNTIRGGGDGVVDRSREAVRRQLPANASSLQRRTTKKPATKPEKPRWQTILRIFTKNFLLLLIIVGLVQIVRQLAVKPVSKNSDISSDFEGRIAELESLVKTTTEIMQLQVDAVDKKMENEIETLTEKLNKQIEEKDLELGAQLKKLSGRTEDLEKLLGELKSSSSSDWLTKQDFDRIFDEFKKAGGAGNGDERASLDDLRAAAKEIVKKEIEKHVADGLGRVDFALASGGGMVVKHSDPYTVGKGSAFWSSLYNGNKVDGDAKKMLTPSFGEPGQCFPLKGSCGYVKVKLRTAIVPEAITLEHVSKSVAYDRSSAPKNCRVSGWFQESSGVVDEVVDANKMFLLTEFTYDLEKSNAQTFNVLDSASVGTVNMIRFDFTSNHGSPSHTCIYRLRVHGFEPESVLMLPTQS